MSLQRCRVSSVLTVLLLLLCMFANKALAGVIIIANPTVQENEMDLSVCRSIFLGEKSQWGNGEAIVPVVLREGPTHEEFLKTFVKKTPNQFLNFWKRAIFVGTGSPPKSFPTEKELLEHVRRTTGAIGYIDSSTGHEGVKLLTVR